MQARLLHGVVLHELVECSTEEDEMAIFTIKFSFQLISNLLEKFQVGTEPVT